MADLRKLNLDWLDYLLLHVVCAYTLVAPYTKVEESFNIQAIHDMIFYGSDISKYDHLQFAGVVPRTFVGALIISLVTKPIEYLFPFWRKIELQSVSRLVLGVINMFSLINLRHNIRSLFGNSVSKWFMIFLISQFHIIYYSSRTLPNMFALPLVVYAFTVILQEQYQFGLSILAFASIVFRVELILLTGTLGLVLLATRKASFKNILHGGFLGIGFGSILSLAVDSYFWQQFPKIPEVDGFIFNAIQGKSSFWGEEPYWAYFTHHIPNLTNNPLILLLAPIGLLIADKVVEAPPKVKKNSKLKERKKLGIKKSIVTSTTASISPIVPLRILSATSLLYVLIYSIQPHKEWRFIIYIMPVITLLAANGVSILSKRRSRTFIFVIVPIIVFLSTLIAMQVSIMKLLTSSVNYPGGAALTEFHEIYQEIEKQESTIPESIIVHLDVPVCMTGASRFGQLWDSANFTSYVNGTKSNETHPLVIYDKTEDVASLEQIWSTFDYFVGVANINQTTIPTQPGYQWDTLASIPGLDGFNTKFVIDLIDQIKSDPKSVANTFKSNFITTYKTNGLWGLLALITDTWNQLVITSDYVYIYKKVQILSPLPVDIPPSPSPSASLSSAPAPSHQKDSFLKRAGLNAGWFADSPLFN